MRKKINWGILGLGNIAKKFADAIEAVEDANLYAVASRDLNKSRKFSKDVVPYGSYIELLEDSKVDAVYIAVPNVYHKELSILALNHGKAVLCEKPVTMNAKELEAVITLAQHNHLFFMEAMKTRFLPAIQEVKNKLHLLGEITYIHGDQTFMSQNDPTHHLYQKKMGGGALMDIGIYPFSLTQYLIGYEPENLSAHFYYNDTEVDTGVSIQANNPNLQLYASIQSNSPRNFLIAGTKGWIQIPMFSNAQSYLMNINNETHEYRFPHLVNGLEYQIKEATVRILNQENQSPHMSWDDSLSVMRWMDKIKK